MPERFEPKIPPINPDLLRQLKELRRRVHVEMGQELTRRLSTNPEPTDEEMIIGAFREMLEPQVRDVVFEMYRKGYATGSSGFYWEGRMQSVDGWFTIDPDTVDKIKALGAEVRRTPGGYTFIEFVPETADLAELKKKWDAIASVLPQLDQPAFPSRTGAATDWRQAYANPQRTEKIWKERQ